MYSWKKIHNKLPFLKHYLTALVNKPTMKCI